MFSEHRLPASPAVVLPAALAKQPAAGGPRILADPDQPAG